MIYSKYCRNKLVDAAFRGGTITFPTTYYVGLITAAPDVNDSYSEIGNVTANGYARVSIAANATNFASTAGAGTTTTPSAGTTATSSNNIDIVFANPTGPWMTGSPGTATPIVGLGFFDALTAGNLWFYVPISPKAVEAYHTAPTIKAGQAILTLDK